MFISCQDITPVEKPEYFISEKQMEEIMYQSVLLKSARGYSIGKLTTAGIDPQKYVLEKFEIDSAQYAENIAYYSSQTQIYTALNTRVKDRILAVYEIEDSLEKVEIKIKDSLRLKRTRELEAERMKRLKKDSLGLDISDSLPPISQRYKRRTLVTKIDSL